jgi:hypothetical protein
MVDKKKLGFDGQWVDGTPIGRHKDSDGDFVDIDVAFLEAVVKNFNLTKALHEPPAVIGHPKSDAPAYGYVANVRVNNGRLERQFSQINPEFEEMVRTGAFKKRSDAFYLKPEDAPGGLVPALRHCGFLGAQPPAIKGLADIHFAEGDKEVKTVDVEVDTAINFSEGDTETMKDEDVKKTIRASIAEFFEPLMKMLGGSEKPASASFSEADRQKLIDDATTAATAKFSEELKKQNDEIERLKADVDSQGNGSRRAEVVAFFEKMQAKGIMPPALKDRVVNLMDALAGLPDKKVTVITFEEENGKEVEKKEDHTLLREFQEFVQALPPYIKFGEAFGDVRPKGDGKDVLDPQRKQQSETMDKVFGLDKKEAKTS